MSRKIPFFPHQTGRTISIDNATEGDYPNTRVLMFDEQGGLHQENVPVTFIGEEVAHEVYVDLSGGGKAGYIIIG